jgi:hypothetical protein
MANEAPIELEVVGITEPTDADYEWLAELLVDLAEAEEEHQQE